MKKRDKDCEEELKSALLKKALGYLQTEITEEYNLEEGEIKLSKKRVTKKSVPPDLTAIKFLLDEGVSDVSQMTDEELEAEKERLLEMMFKAEKSKKERKK